MTIEDSRWCLQGLISHNGYGNRRHLVLSPEHYVGVAPRIALLEWKRPEQIPDLVVGIGIGGDIELIWSFMMIAWQVSIDNDFIVVLDDGRLVDQPR